MKNTFLCLILSLVPGFASATKMSGSIPLVKDYSVNLPKQMASELAGQPDFISINTSTKSVPIHVTYNAKAFAITLSGAAQAKDSGKLDRLLGSEVSTRVFDGNGLEVNTGVYDAKNCALSATDSGSVRSVSGLCFTYIEIQVVGETIPQIKVNGNFLSI